MNTVFFNAQESAIKITMADGYYAVVDAAGISYAENDVADAMLDLGAEADDCFVCSSDVDFCEEEGFEPGEARDIIHKAIADLKKTLETNKEFAEENDADLKTTLVA